MTKIFKVSSFLFPNLVSLPWQGNHCPVFGIYHSHAFLYSSGPSTITSEPAASIAHGNFLEIQILRPRLRLTELEALRERPRNVGYKSPRRL